MSDKKNRNHSAVFKKKVVLKVLERTKSVAEICKEFGLYESQVYKWKSQALALLEGAFEKGKRKNNEKVLHRKINKLQVERDFLANAWAHYQESVK